MKDMEVRVPLERTIGGSCKARLLGQTRRLLSAINRYRVSGLKAGTVRLVGASFDKIGDDLWRVRLVVAIRTDGFDVTAVTRNGVLKTSLYPKRDLRRLLEGFDLSAALLRALGAK